MFRAIAAALTTLAAWAACGCMAQATPEEIRKMCENYAVLNGADKVPSKEALTADIDAMFAQLEKDIKAGRDEQVKLWDADLKVQLANAKDDAAKAELQKLMADRTQQADEKMKLDLASLQPGKAEKLAGADAEIKKAKANLDETIKKCVDKATAEKITQELAQCRIDAKTLDKYNQVCY
jgi:hypothetical protein